MKPLLIEPHYLGSLEFYCLVTHAQQLILDISSRYQKQTYRNRCYLLGSNKVISLTVPVSYSSVTLYKDVIIDHSQSWKKDHWGAIYSAYGKAPYFEFFAEEFKNVLEKRHQFLVDLNMDFLKVTLKLLQHDVNLTLSQELNEREILDYRNNLSPKKHFSHRKIYHPHSYSQLFSDNFIPNLSILDLIMCVGPQAKEVLSASFLIK